MTLHVSYVTMLQIFPRNNSVSGSFQIYTLMLAAEGLVVKEEGDPNQIQQKQGNAATGTDHVSTSPKKSLSSAEEHSSSEGNSYGRYGMNSENSGLGSESIALWNTGISSETIGVRSIGLSSGEFESNLRSGKIVLLAVKGLEHDSGLGGTGLGSSGYSLGTGSFKGAEFGGDLRDGASATSQFQVTSVTQELPVSVPQPIPVPVPAPYLVEVPRPVQASIPHPLGGIVDRHYPVTIARPIPVPVPVPQPVPTPVPRPYFIVIPQPARLQIPQPVAVPVPVPRPVTVALPHQVAMSSVSETDVGVLKQFSRGVYSSGKSYSTSAASFSESGHSDIAKGLGYSSGGNFVYKSNHGSSGLDVGQVSTPLRGVYVPSYLGGLHGSYGGPNSTQRPSYVEGYTAGDYYSGRRLQGPRH